MVDADNVDGGAVVVRQLPARPALGAVPATDHACAADVCAGPEAERAERSVALGEKAARAV